jgi:hypothetical protein
VSSAEIYWELVEKIGNLEKEKNNKEVIKNTLNDLGRGDDLRIWDSQALANRIQG